MSSDGLHNFPARSSQRKMRWGEEKKTEEKGKRARGRSRGPSKRSDVVEEGKGRVRSPGWIAAVGVALFRSHKLGDRKVPVAEEGRENSVHGKGRPTEGASRVRGPARNIKDSVGKLKGFVRK